MKDQPSISSLSLHITISQTPLHRWVIMSLSGPLCAVNIFPRSSAVRFHASMTRFHPRARVQFSAAAICSNALYCSTLAEWALLANMSIFTLILFLFSKGPSGWNPTQVWCPARQLCGMQELFSVFNSSLVTHTSPPCTDRKCGCAVSRSSVWVRTKSINTTFKV